MSITEISARSVLHYHKREYATNWDINTYRGCEHKCAYCFAQYSHKYLNSQKFFDEITVKTNIPQVLEHDFSNKNWNYPPVNAGGVTDCYQPIEKKYQLMPKIIKTFIKYKNPLIITTKSTLILRDIDLLTKLNNVTSVKILVSASTINENIRQKLEPFAPPTIDRINMIKTFTEHEIESDILLMPIIPYINDNLSNIEHIFQLGKQNQASAIIHGILHLRGQTKTFFLKFLQKCFPKVTSSIEKLYNGSYVDKKYSEYISNMIYKLHKKYGMFNQHCELRSPNKNHQLALF